MVLKGLVKLLTGMFPTFVLRRSSQAWAVISMLLGIGKAAEAYRHHVFSRPGPGVRRQPTALFRFDEEATPGASVLVIVHLAGLPPQGLGGRASAGTGRACPWPRWWPVH